MTTTKQEVKISLKQYFEQRYEAGEQATMAAIIRAFRRAVDGTWKQKPYELQLQSYTILFKEHVEKIFAFLLDQKDAWWCDIEDQVEEMVQALMVDQLRISRLRKLALLA